MPSITLYHGSSRKFGAFSYTNLNPGGNLQEGPGFYLTTSEKDARSYGKYIYTVQVSYTKLVPQRGVPKREELIHIVRSSPNLRDNFWDWGETPEQGVMAAVNSYMRFSKHPHDAFQQAWVDWYRHDIIPYLKEMVRLRYDGVKINKTDGVKHFIAFNPLKLRIVNIEDTSKQKSR